MKTADMHMACLRQGQVSMAFLNSFVKSADSAKARRELPLLKQEGQNMNKCITEGFAIDSTTLAF